MQEDVQFVGRVCGEDDGTFSLRSLMLEGSIRHSQVLPLPPLHAL